VYNSREKLLQEKSYKLPDTPSIIDNFKLRKRGKARKSPSLGALPRMPILDLRQLCETGVMNISEYSMFHKSRKSSRVYTSDWSEAPSIKVSYFTHVKIFVVCDFCHVSWNCRASSTLWAWRNNHAFFTFLLVKFVVSSTHRYTNCQHRQSTNMWRKMDVSNNLYLLWDVSTHRVS